MRYALPALLLLTGCTALGGADQSRRDRVYQDIEEGRLTAAEASQRDREPPVDLTEVLLVLATVLGVGTPVSMGATNLMRNHARRKRGEVV